jgi:hypothetical protein
MGTIHHVEEQKSQEEIAIFFFTLFPTKTNQPDTFASAQCNTSDAAVARIGH